MHKGIKKNANTQIYLRVCVFSCLCAGRLLDRDFLILQDSTLFVNL